MKTHPGDSPATVLEACGPFRLVLGSQVFPGPDKQGWEGWYWSILDAEGAVVARSSGYFGRRATAEMLGRWALLNPSYRWDHRTDDAHA